MNFKIIPDQAYLRHGKLEPSPPPRFAGVDFDDFFEQNPGAATSLELFVSSLKTGSCIDNDFVLSAPRFSGKTSTAFAVMDACVKKRIKAAYVDYFDLITTLSSQEHGEDLVELLCNYDLLVIDDLGSNVFGVEREVAEMLMFRLIDQRYIQCLRTMIVTGIRWENIATVGYGINARIADRIRGAVVTTGWED